MGLDDTFPFRDLPWLRPTLALCLAVAGLWLLAAPVAAILRPVIVGARRGIDRVAEELSLRADSAQRRRRAARDAARVQAARTAAYITTGTEDDAAGAAALARTAAALEALADRLRSFGEDLMIAVRRVGVIGDQLQQLGGAALDHVQWATRDLRIARAQLLMSTLLLACLVAVNTGMLSEILRALDIGNRLEYAGVQLTYVFAFLLTLAEAGIGFLHGVFSDAQGDGEERRLRPAAAFAVLGAVVVAAVEGSFYGRIGENREPLVILEVAIPMPVVFFAWGFVLVLLLFGLGVVWYRALSVTRSGSVHAEIRRHFRALAAAAESCRRQLGELERLRARAANEVPPAPNARGPWASDSSLAGGRVGLTAEDMGVLETRSALWALLAVVSGVAFYLVWQQTIASLYPGLHPWAARAVAAGHMALFFTAGLTMRGIESTIHRRAVHGRGFGHLRSALGSILCLTIAAAGFAVLAYRASRAGLGGGWLLALPTAVALMFAGREQSALIGLLGPVLRSVVDVVLRWFDLALVFLMRAVGVVLVVVEFLLSVIMAPLTSGFSRFGHRDGGKDDGGSRREGDDTYRAGGLGETAAFDTAGAPASPVLRKGDLEVQ